MEEFVGGEVGAKMKERSVRLTCTSIPKKSRGRYDPKGAGQKDN